MKKSICLLMAIILLLSLCGCGEMSEPELTPKPTLEPISMPTPTPNPTFSNGLTLEENDFVGAVYRGTSDWDNLESIKVVEIYNIEAEITHYAIAKIQYVDKTGEQIAKIYGIALQGNSLMEEGTMVESTEDKEREPSDKYNLEAINNDLQNEYNYMLSMEKYKELTGEELVVLYTLFNGTKHWNNKESIKVLEISDLIQFPTSVYAKIQRIDENGEQVSKTYYVERLYTGFDGTVAEVENEEWEPNTEYNLEAINYQLQNEYIEYMLEQEGQ